MLVIDLVIILGSSMVFGVSFIGLALGGGTEGLNSALPVLFSDLIIIMFIPSLYIASKIIKDGPFPSYSSSRGGWNIKLYLKALIIPIILFALYMGIDTAINGAKGTYHFSILFLIVLFISLPIQSIAEEYMFRGFLLQMLGSWSNIPALAVVIQAIIFAMAHGYNSFGFLEVLAMGLVCGFFAWKTNGIEISSAIHTANNFILGFFIMFGLQISTGAPDIFNSLATVALIIIIGVLMYYVGEKTEWFGEIPES